ncbi:MAG: hypothetical protein ACE1ZO_05370, partial [Nitrospirales bacterium]
MSLAWYDQVTSFCRGKRLSVLSLQVCLLVLFMHQGSVMAVESGSATEAIKGTIDQVLVILGDEKFKQPEYADEGRAALEQVM